ncbi:MAG: heterodisulfide reductase-related iron-sulfur binding cluster [Thermoleophilia bacterium]
MRLVLLEPSGTRKRGVATHPLLRLTPGSGGGVEGRDAGPEADRVRLRSLRAAVEGDPLAAARRLADILREQGVAVVEAGDATAAASAIAGFVRGGSLGTSVVGNNSSVLKELGAELEAVGVRLTSGYPGRAVPDSEPVITRGWQLPAHPAAAGGDTFVEHVPRPRLEAGAADGGRSDVTAVLGVSAAGEDGSFAWVQHFENISLALSEAGRVVLVMGVDKVLPDEEAALLQAGLAASFGWAARILDGADGAAGAVAERLWAEAAAVAPGRPEVLVVLLDNGRSALAGSPFSPLLRCISCRACRKDCPTQSWFGGELKMSPVEYVRFFLLGLHGDLGLCVGCGKCEQSCPVDIDIPLLIARARDERGLAHYVRDFALMNPELLGRCGSLVLGGSTGGRKAGILVEKAVGVHRDFRMPPFARKDFYQVMEQRGSAPVYSAGPGENVARSGQLGAAVARGAKGRPGDAGGPGDTGGAGDAPRVVLFSGCFVNYHDVEQGVATVRLLEKAGFTVDVPRHHCCDIPKLQGGSWRHARRRALENVRMLKLAARGAEAVVTGCPSCARALADFYPELLGAEAAWLKTSVRELFLFLRESGFDPRPGRSVSPRAASGTEVSATASPDSDNAGDLLYHVPCHYPAVDPDLSLLGFFESAGASVSEVARGCCGMSGSFGMKTRSYALSREIAADAFTSVREFAGTTVMTNCGACRLQLEQGTGRDVLHPAVVLDSLTSRR